MNWFTLASKIRNVSWRAFSMKTYAQNLTCLVFKWLHLIGHPCFITEIQHVYSLHNMQTVCCAYFLYGVILVYSYDNIPSVLRCSGFHSIWRSQDAYRNKKPFTVFNIAATMLQNPSALMSRQVLCQHNRSGLFFPSYAKIAQIFHRLYISLYLLDHNRSGLYRS